MEEWLLNTMTKFLRFSIQPILHLHTLNTMTHLLHGPDFTMRPFVITIGLPIVIMQVRTLFSKCPTLLIDQVVLTLLDSRCVVEHGVCCFELKSLCHKKRGVWTPQCDNLKIGSMLVADAICMTVCSRRICMEFTVMDANSEKNSTRNYRKCDNFVRTVSKLTYELHIWLIDNWFIY